MYYLYDLFLISSASIRSLPFLSFVLPVFGWNVPLIFSVFLKKSLVLPFLLFSSIFFCIVHWRRPSCLSLLLSAFSCMYLSLSLLLFTSLLSSTICKASSDNHSAFLHFFFFGMVLFATSYTIIIVWASVHILQAFCSLDQIPWIYSSLPLYIYKAFDLNHTWQA